MATERRRVLRALAVLPAMVLLAAPPTVHAAEPWWQPLGYAGERVTGVSAAGGHVAVKVGAASYLSTDAGRTFVQTGAAGALADAGSTTWAIHNGVVVTGRVGRALVADPHAPSLGASAQLIAAPAATPGVVVAVGSDNHVWRRASSGQWATSFILLPAGGLSGAPRVTALAAFDAQPLSGALYMGTDGYGVLVSENGGDDWIRADPGLPENVLGLATNSSQRALYAATDNGLFVHHLQALPAPPVYQDASLYLRWLGIGLVALVAAAAAVLGLRRLVPAPPRTS